MTHSYSVQLRISGARLIPHEISDSLRLQPNLIRIAGQKGGREGTWSESLWSYNGSSSDNMIEWDSLELGLMSLIEKLWINKSQIQSLSNEFNVVLWCGHFQTSFDGGPTFSVALLEKLADFGVPLFLDNYFPD